MSVIGLISTNYGGEKLGKLVENRPVASVPFGGRYRLIDFSLSSMVNSGITSVGVITPVNYRSLADHLNMGREWGLNKKQGGMFMLPGAQHSFRNLTSRFSVQDIAQNREFFARADQDTVLFCGANRIYNMDFRPAIKRHIETDAQITLIYRDLADTTDANGLYLDVNSSNTVIGIRSEAKKSDKVFLDAMLISRKLVMNFIDWYANLGYADLMDILAGNLDRLHVRAWCFTGYEHAIDTGADYMKVSKDLLRPEVQDQLFNADRPILTKTQDSPPAKYLPGAIVKNSMIAASCKIQGTVENSTLFRNVEIGKGAIVRNCVLMQHCIIEDGAVVENLICDKNCRISGEVKISGSEKKPFVMARGMEL